MANHPSHMMRIPYRRVRVCVCCGVAITLVDKLINTTTDRCIWHHELGKARKRHEESPHEMDELLIKDCEAKVQGLEGQVRGLRSQVLGMIPGARPGGDAAGEAIRRGDAAGEAIDDQAFSGQRRGG